MRLQDQELGWRLFISYSGKGSSHILLISCELEWGWFNSKRLICLEKSQDRIGPRLCHGDCSQLWSRPTVRESSTQREPRDMRSIHFGEASSLSGFKGTDKADGNSSCNCWRGLALFKGNLVFGTRTIGKVPVGQDPTHLRLQLIKNANSFEKILIWIPCLNTTARETCAASTTKT